MNKTFTYSELDVDSLELMELFLQQVECYPDQLAVITTERTLCYIELAQQAQSLATHLLQLGVKNEMPVAILLKSGIEHVVCQIAILLAGGSCVPLNVASPNERLNFMLQEAKVTFTLTESSLAGRALSTRYVLLDTYPRNNIFSNDLPGRKAGLGHRAYIMFTSGTTGKPKAVEIEYRGILRLVVNADYLPISTQDRIGSISAPDFDAILFEVWGALLNGAATVIIDREVLLDPEKLKSSFIDNAVSSIIVTPSLFNFVTTLCPDAFRTLSYLLIGGEAFNLHALRSLPLNAWPKNIYNIYGPTENTTYTLYYSIGLDDLAAESMPLGWPINKTEVFILDEQLQLADVGVLGEIYVSGDGVARGYLNRPDLTAEKFITIEIKGETGLKRLYKTGDFGWKRTDGAFMYSGRMDNQIKLQGYRIELEEVEIQLLNTGLLLEAIVCAIKNEGNEGYLIAFVVPQDPLTFSRKQLLSELQKLLPSYMLPRIHIIDAILLNSNGKADRPKLIELYRQATFVWHDLKYPLKTNRIENMSQQHQLAGGELTDLFLHQVKQRSEQPAIITAEYTLSYSQLAEQAQRLAEVLCQQGVQLEDPVAILLDTGAEYIICQLAVLLAGGTCVPLHPSLPDERLNFMLQEVQAKLTITDASLATRALSTHFILFNNHPLTDSEYVGLLVRDKGLNQRSHILFTSGTTGQPKGVEIEARGIVRMLVNSSIIRITPSDRFACYSTPSFDASLLEVWGPLLNGAALVIITKETLLDPKRLEDAIQQYAISYLYMTTSLFSFIAPQCPNAFRSLNYLLIGGETFNLQALKSLPPAAWPKNLLNGYGPTEGTTLTLCHRIVADDMHGETVPIGRPLDKTEVYILDERLNPVTPGEQGEIYIGGEGIARGYINRPELTQEKFLTVEIAGESSAKRLYRSGDMAWQRPDGSIMYGGRVDNQIKLHGYRIEINEIEIQLLKSEQLLAAVVCVIRAGTDEAYLTAFIVPKYPASFETNSLLNSLKHQLPPYMLPRLQVMEAIPIDENGKANRSLLRTQVEEQRVTDECPSELYQNAAELLLIWQQVLDVPHPSLDDDFFLLGGTSLQAARLVLEIKRQFEIRLSIQDLYDAQTPRNLLHSLQQTQEVVTDDICATLLMDSQLPDDIQPNQQSLQPWLSLSAGRVLLTGATGFMGVFCLRDLLCLDDVRQVTCLVRAKDHDTALQRVKDNMIRYGLWQQKFSSRILALAGDLSQPQFGLNSASYRHLTTDCDVIFHTAAHISFIEPYQTHRATNVLGAINLLRFAVENKAKPLHYVSTIAAIGPAGLLFPVERFYEEDDLMPYLEGLKYTLGYIQSKWVAERLMWQARERGIALAVYRPGFMMTDSVSGAGNPEDFMWRMIKGCIITGASPLLPGDRKELIPVDYASAALIRLASDNSRLGHVYHLIPPSDEHSISLNVFFELIEHCGYALTRMPYKQWLQHLYDDPNLDANPLMPLLPMLSEVVYEDLTVWEVFRNIPRYDSSLTQEALTEAGGANYTPTNTALLTLYLDYMKSIGLL